MRINRKKVLITGINGYVGGSLGEYFSEQDYEIVPLQRKENNDPYSLSVLVKIINKEKPNLVIHAAGSAAVAESFKNPEQDFANSVLLTKKVLDGIKESRVRPSFIFISSAAVYGNNDCKLISEDSPLKPISPYGFHKRLCELLCEQYAKFWGIPVIIIRLFSTFGFRQKRLLVWELFEQFNNQKKKIVTLKGTGKEIRDYLSIDQISIFLEKIWRQETNEFAVYNVARGESIKVLALAKLIKKILNSKKKIVCLGKKMKGDPVNWSVDTTKIRKIVGDKKAISLEKDLAQCFLLWTK